MSKWGYHCGIVRVLDPYLASLVLSDLVLGVLLAVSALAVGAASLGNVDLQTSLRQRPLFISVSSCLCSPSVRKGSRGYMYRGLKARSSVRKTSAMAPCRVEVA